ncbi:TIGR00295 family protein [Methanococcoides methylutens]|uniref:Metal-dependent phosphohydrolase n=1 Tax=Methanococcoides methylutens MM1 TaxID=1434104 RepID=A0A0E3X096_METMT|nr:TIGR00295 family protein [Methanococcoides methylutens]AKB85054.1 metal-dependent phosphohydrolase [Methanococcoides methylutens MM1]
MITTSDALKLLKEAGCAANVIRHCQVVSQIAVEIAVAQRDSGKDVDLEIVELGALFHDIGRSRTHGIRHAIEGVSVAEELGLDPRLVLIIRNHIGAGISRQEALLLGLPEDDYLPVSIEEKIVCHADNLVMGEERVNISKCIQRMKDRGMSDEAIARVRDLADEVGIV